MEQILATMERVARQVDGTSMEPDRARTDWAAVSKEVDALVADTQPWVLAESEALFSAIENPAAREELRAATLDLVSETAAILIASGRRDKGMMMLHNAARIAPGEQRVEFQAAQEDTDSWLDLVHGRWCLRQGFFTPADKVLKAGKKRTKNVVLKKALDKAMSTPRPLTHGAPSLSSINGIGTAIYGERDRAGDGSYVTTHWIIALFVPIFPLGAYRVINNGGGSYTFFSKERLGPIARAWRFAMPALVMLGIAGLWFNSWYNSPERLVSVATEEARALEDAGNVDEALAAYDGVLGEYNFEVGSRELQPAALGVMRLTIAGIEEPMTADRAAEASRAVLRLEQLPGEWTGARNEVTELLLGKLREWSEQIRDGTLEGAQASLTLLRQANALSPGDEIQAEIVNRELDVADQLAPEWPLFALEIYGARADSDRARGALRIFESVQDSNWLLASLLPTINAISAVNSESASAFEGIRSAAVSAESALVSANRLEALESGDEAQLRAALLEFPKDQEIVRTLADTRRATGELEEALSLLESLGGPGYMMDETLQLYAASLTDTGRLEEAGEILSQYLVVRMPSFQSAQRAYDTATNALVERLRTQASIGRLPMDLEARLTGARGDDEQQEIFGQWLSERVESDPELAALRTEYERTSGVVPAALQLGTVKLRLANSVSGDEREARLAEAERAFLAIREQAEGVPSFHLGLGQVYHRLGKSDEGEQEFAGVLALANPDLDIAVSSVYRELGLMSRAREVAERVFNAGQQPFADAAAAHLAIMSDTLGDKETWLARVVEPTFQVETDLLNTRAHRSLEAGNYDEADRQFAEVAERYGRNAEHDSAATNNQALAYLSRYQATGSMTHLARGIDGLERALRLAPDSSLSMGNLAAVHAQQANLRVLTRWIRPASLRLNASEASSLLADLADGPLRENLLTALRQDASFRRSNDLTSQVQVLSPQLGAAYEHEADRLTLFRDDAGLEDLRLRVERAGVDTSSGQEIYAKWVAGELDAEFTQSFDASVRVAQGRLAEAEQAGHRPTTGAAYFLLGEALLRRSTMAEDHGPSDIAAAIVAFESASEHFPQLDTRTHIGWAKVQAAVSHTATADPQFAAQFRTERRALSLAYVLHQMSEDPSRRATLDRIREHPEFRAGLALLSASHQPDHPKLSLWALGNVAGDAQLVEAMAGALTSPRIRTRVEIDGLLTPYSESASVQRSLLDAQR
ncbi:MAG: hypothetical protein AB8H86_19010 [Polyangiales bacterium]